VLLRTPAMDAVEAELATAMVGGSQPEVNSEQVLNQLTRFYQVDEGSIRVRYYHSGGFLVNFTDATTMDKVLHANRLQGVELVLIF
jgi:hypothetical protein